MNEKTKVLLVGETWNTYTMHFKGFDMIASGAYEDFAVWFKESLSRKDDIEITHISNQTAMADFPKTLEALNRYDVVIISDCGKNNLLLYPDMFKVPMGPNRLELIKKYVAKGNSFIMVGGWNSYQGMMGIAGYHSTPIEDILPVKIQPYDDRVEKPEGVIPVILKKEHPILSSLPEEWPMFLGYNRVIQKEGSELLATIGGEPFITIWNYEKGKTLSFTSDLAKHWGSGFIEWKAYGDFWYNVLKWLKKS